MIFMDHFTGTEILINFVFFVTGVDAVIYGIIGVVRYTQTEIWWAAMGVITIALAFWIDITRHATLPLVDGNFLFWSRQVASSLVFAGWVLLAYKMGYLRKTLSH